MEKNQKDKRKYARNCIIWLIQNVAGSFPGFCFLFSLKKMYLFFSHYLSNARDGGKTVCSFILLQTREPMRAERELSDKVQIKYLCNLA